MESHKIGGASVAALTLLLAHSAQAGSWQELRKEYDGTQKIHYDNYPEPPDPPNGPLDRIYQWSVIGSTGNDSGSAAVGSPRGSGGWGQSSGQVRTVYKWRRNLLGGSGPVYGSGSGSSGPPDPNDNPPAVLYLKITVSASAKAASDDSAANRDASKEQVSASAMGETGTVVDSGYEKNSLVSLVRLVQAQTGGREEVAGPWCALNARAEVLTNRYFSEPLPPGSYGPPRPIPITGRFQAFTSYGSQTDTRGVIITSPTIETSYWKDSLRRTAHERAADGSIVTDSVLDFSESNGAWFARAQFVAEVIGFTSPTYKWSGTGNGDTTRYTSVNLQKGQGFKNISATSDTITVEVTDGPGTDGAKGSNTFKVTWHPPNEKWAMLGEPKPNGKRIFAKPGYYVDSNGVEQTSLEPNRTIHFEIEAPVTGYNLKKGLETGSIVVGAAGASGVAIWLIAVPTATTPAGWVAVALAATTGAAGLVAGSMPAPTLDTKESGYAQYKADMRFQKQINDARAADPNAYPNEESRCGDPAFVNAAVAEIARVESIGGAWDADKYFAQIVGTLRCSAKAGRYRQQELWKGDEYDTHGYAGPIDAEITPDKDVFYLFNWTFAGATPPPPTP